MQSLEEEREEGEQTCAPLFSRDDARDIRLTGTLSQVSCTDLGTQRCFFCGAFEL